MKLNIVFDQRIRQSLAIAVLDDNEDPFNMTGYSGVSQMRKHWGSSNSIPLTVALSNGEILLTCPKTVANTVIDPGQYLYDVIIYDSANTEIKILEGLATIKGTVTIR